MKTVRAALSLVVVVLAVSCASEPKDRKTPANAFARLAPCVDAEDARCLFQELERSSRWSLQTIHKTLVRMRGLIERSYPVEKRRGASAYGGWEDAAAQKDDAGAFASFCAKKKCMEALVRGFGAVTSERSRGAGAVDVITTRGGVFSMAVADGEWGLATFAEELAAEKVRLLDSLAQVELDAAAYDEQRRAMGGANH